MRIPLQRAVHITTTLTHMNDILMYKYLQQRFSVELREATAAAIASQHLVEKKQKTKSHSRQLLNFNKIQIKK